MPGADEGRNPVISSQSPGPRFGFKRQHGEDALVYPPQRFTTSHPVQGLQPEGVLTQCE